MSRAVHVTLVAATWFMLCAVTVPSAVHAGGIREYKRAMAEMTIDEVDLQSVPDGRYLGAFDAGLVQSEVAVTVRAHRIEVIELIRHQHGRGAAGEAVIGRVVTEQRLGVDAVSGATGSSRVIVKAIETALRSAGQ